MADISRLIHLLPLPHLGAAAVVGEDTAVEEDVAVVLRDRILEGEGTEAEAGEEIDSLSLRRVVGKGGTLPSRTLAGMTTAAVVDMVVIVDVVSRFDPGLKMPIIIRPLVNVFNLTNLVDLLD